MKPTGKLKNVYISVLILAIIIAGGSWYYISTLTPDMQVQMDKADYFHNESPEMEVLLNNPKNATSGEITLKYSADIVNISKSEISEGVEMKELDDNLIFALSEEFFDNNSKTIAKVYFEGTSRGYVDIVFDRDESFLTSEAGNIEIGNYTDARFALGETPARSHK